MTHTERAAMKRAVFEGVHTARGVVVQLTGLQCAQIAIQVLRKLWPEHQVWCSVFSHPTHANAACNCGVEQEPLETKP